MTSAAAVTLACRPRHEQHVEGQTSGIMGVRAESCAHEAEQQKEIAILKGLHTFRTYEQKTKDSRIKFD